MAKTNADYQREHRERRVKRLTELLEENAARDVEIAGLRAALAVAEAELERLAGLQCRHPASAVDGGSCRACGAEVW